MRLSSLLCCVSNTPARSDEVDETNKVAVREPVTIIYTLHAFDVIVVPRVLSLKNLKKPPPNRIRHSGCKACSTHLPMKMSAM